MAGNPLQRIPSLERMLQREDIAALIAQHGRTLVLDALRTVSQSLRARLSADSAAADRDADQGDIAASLAQLAGAEVAAQTQTGYRPVFNLTGTVLHTNLGRAVLPRQAVQALMAVAGQPAAIEFDLAAGGRGNRDEPVEALLMRLTGAEAATVVNNNAAAVLLSLNTLAAGREVIVSRGELVEIGGAFRMPEIMASAGCQLREVGTTNRTHLHDYADAIGPATAALMTVHPSNYQIQGFTSRAAAAEIATLAHQRGLPLIDDLGSGSLISLKTFGLPHEPTVSQALAAGADVVTFSGDKLLGGPQCGLIVGRADLIDRIRRNPMKRALRVDKLTLAALDAVLRLYLAPERLTAELPALRQLTRELTDIQACAARIMKSSPVIVRSAAGRCRLMACQVRRWPLRRAPMPWRACRWRNGLMRCAGSLSRCWAGCTPIGCCLMCGRSSRTTPSLLSLPIWTPCSGRADVDCHGRPCRPWQDFSGALSYRRGYRPSAR